MLSPEEGEGVLVDLLEELVELEGGVEVVVAMPASVAIRPVQGPGARGSVVTKLGDRQAGPRTRPPCHNGRCSTIVIVEAQILTSRRTWSRASAGTRWSQNRWTLATAGSHTRASRATMKSP
jgi:hypothetical protein